jgi:K+-transporting ATPase ATPase A chain
MTLVGWIQIFAFFAVTTALTPLLGRYFYRVLEEGRPPLARLTAPIERTVFRLVGVDPARDEQDWRQYALALLVWSMVTLLVTYAVLRLQGRLPANPRRFPAVGACSAWNTAVSFATNTNWQGYGGESTLSYLAQMLGLAWQNFVSAAAGVGVALALARGIVRRKVGEAGLGNFWVDLVRAALWIFLPIAFAAAIALVSMGVPQTLDDYPRATTLEGETQSIAVGPIASQESIKELGTNGGGFLNANSAHPYENPTPFSNFLELVLIFSVPAGLIYTYGIMAGDIRQGWALLAACALLFFAGVIVCYGAEAKPSAALAGLPVDPAGGNLEGKEVRFGVPASALWAVVTTDTSCGAVNAMHDSFNPLGGLVPLVNIQLGELVFGGAGAGLYALLVMAVISVFLAGLMVGRTPELLGKKIEGREVKLAMLYVLIFPALILGGTAAGAVADCGLSSLGNAGPHGLSEILYAFSSAAGNNGSAFAGLDASTPWYEVTLGVAMLAGRFFMIVPALALAGSLVGKRHTPPGLGTFPTNGPTFSALLVAVIVIVGALTFLPALALGPIAEHFAAGAGALF